MRAIVTLGGLSRPDAERRVMELGAEIISASETTSGGVVIVDAYFEGEAADRLALADCGGLLSALPIPEKTRASNAITAPISLLR